MRTLQRRTNIYTRTNEIFSQLVSLGILNVPTPTATDTLWAVWRPQHPDSCLEMQDKPVVFGYALNSEEVYQSTSSYINEASYVIGIQISCRTKGMNLERFHELWHKMQWLFGSQTANFHLLEGTFNVENGSYINPTFGELGMNQVNMVSGGVVVQGSELTRYSGIVQWKENYVKPIIHIR